MKKIIVVGMPNKYLDDLISNLEKHPECDSLKKMYTSFQFFKEYKRGAVDMIFLDTSVPDKDIRLFAEKIREMDKTVLIVGVASRKDPVMVRQFTEIIPNSDFILKTDSNDINVERLLKFKNEDLQRKLNVREENNSIVGDKTILVVDDFENTLDIIEYTLKKSGFEVVTALSGKIAIQELNKGLKPDLIITDLNMPLMDGFELIDAIRKMPRLNGVPIFILTTEFSMAKKIKAKELKITGWIQKPYNITDFINIVTKALK